MASRFRWAIFQLHWLFGITFGVVLGVMGVTGAMMSFEDQIMEALSPGVMNVAPQPAPTLTPDQIVARFTAQEPGAKVNSVVMRGGEGASPGVIFLPAGSETQKAPHSERVYLDPYGGQVLGKATGAEFFATVRRLHRYVLMPDDGKGIGRQITGIAALSLVGFVITGIYLRWPKRPLDWKLWLKPNLKLRKRGLYFSLHQVIGTWVAVIYLVIALTGLTWSYPWYRQGFEWVTTGKVTPIEKPAPKTAKPAPVKPQVLPPLDAAWTTVRTQAGAFETAIVSVPKNAKTPVSIRVLPADAPHERWFDDYKVDGKTGALVSLEPFKDRSLGSQAYSARLAVHRGTFFGLPGAILFMIAAAAMPLFPITGYLLYLGRRRVKTQARAKAALKGQPAPMPAE